MYTALKKNTQVLSLVRYTYHTQHVCMYYVQYIGMIEQ